MAGRIVMKLLAAMCVMVAVSAYSDIDDTVSYDDIAKNPIELKNHLDCFMSKVPCSPVQLVYKSYILPTLQDQCQACSDHHKHNAIAFIRGAMATYPLQFREFLKMYDPCNMFFAKFLLAVKNY